MKYFFGDLLFTSKNQVQRCKEHGSQNACHCFIFFERGSSSFFYKGFLFFLIFIVHKIFIILAKFKQGQDKTARNKEAFSQNIHFEFLKAKRCLLWKFMKILLFEMLLSLALSPARTWGFFPTNLKSFLKEFVQKDLHPKLMVVLLKVH